VEHHVKYNKGMSRTVWAKDKKPRRFFAFIYIFRFLVNILYENKDMRGY